jgi:DNA invertase Pin-like site-specific DNA recombinase
MKEFGKPIIYLDGSNGGGGPSARETDPLLPDQEPTIKELVEKFVSAHKITDKFNLAKELIARVKGRSEENDSADTDVQP